MSDAVRSQTTAQYHAASVLAYGLGQRLSSIVWQHINQPERFELAGHDSAVADMQHSYRVLERLAEIADTVGDVPMPTHVKALVLETQRDGERLWSELEAQEGER